MLDPDSEESGVEGALTLVPLKLLLVSLDSSETYAVCCDTWVIGYPSLLVPDVFDGKKKKKVYMQHLLSKTVDWFRYIQKKCYKTLFFF